MDLHTASMSLLFLRFAVRPVSLVLHLDFAFGIPPGFSPPHALPQQTMEKYSNLEIKSGSTITPSARGMRYVIRESRKPCVISAIKRVGES